MTSSEGLGQPIPGSFLGPALEPLLNTQGYIKGHLGNRTDGFFLSIDESIRPAVLVDFEPIEGCRINELTANFDVVPGMTPEG